MPAAKSAQLVTIQRLWLCTVTLAWLLKERETLIEEPCMDRVAWPMR